MDHKINDIMKNLKKRNLKDTLIPPAGEIWYDKDGKVICHICGKSFNKLSSHIIQVHNINSEKYKEIYGLNKGVKLTSKSMEEYFRNKDRVDITKVSSSTRFKDGHSSPRKRDKARLQTLIERPIEYKKRDR